MPRRKKHKATAAEKQQRVAEIVQLVTLGHDRRAILQHAATTWGLAQRQADEYLAEARKLLREQAEETAADAMARAVAQRADLYRRALAKDDVRTALEVVKDADKLRGLYTDRLKIEMVFTQMTKDRALPVGARRNDVADLHPAVLDDHSVNEQFYQLPALGKGEAV